jgi:hypothetical protein
MASYFLPHFRPMKDGWCISTVNRIGSWSSESTQASKIYGRGDSAGSAPTDQNGKDNILLNASNAFDMSPVGHLSLGWWKGTELIASRA